jgi:hypothetical protein
MLVTPLPIVTDISPLQYENAPYNNVPPVIVTLFKDEGM